MTIIRSVNILNRYDELSPQFQVNARTFAVVQTNGALNTGQVETSVTWAANPYPYAWTPLAFLEQDSIRGANARGFSKISMPSVAPRIAVRMNVAGVANLISGVTSIPEVALVRRSGISSWEWFYENKPYDSVWALPSSLPSAPNPPLLDVESGLWDDQANYYQVWVRNHAGDGSLIDIDIAQGSHLTVEVLE
jgi:hypothetical protein